MTGVRVEAASGEDLDAITDRWVALVADQRAHGSHLNADANRSEARDVISQYVHTGNLAVARSPGSSTTAADDEIVGFVMYHIETGLYEQDVRRGVIDNVYVDPEVRDRDIGTALLDHAEADLESQGADVLSLSVMAENEHARRLYERRGYEPHRVMLEKPTESDTHSKDDE